jgi:aspartyl-tRNA(Asn)/glutamyl-tRNA(Gln) amidotransferase subunit B
VAIKSLSFTVRFLFYFSNSLIREIEPFATDGQVTLGAMDGLDYLTEIRIQQIQLETDSGKSLNGVTPGESLLDFNRSGVGVLEIVTAPDLRYRKGLLIKI